MKKFIQLLAVLILAIPFLLVQPSTVHANSDQVQINLHKIVFPDGQMSESFANTGHLDDAHASLLKDYRGLNDVTFEAYDVTDAFYGLRREGNSSEEAQAALAKQGPSGTKVATETTANVNGQEGTAGFAVPAKSKGVDAVYLFHESQAPANIKAKAQDMVIVLPVYDGDQVMTTLDLYPKNEEQTHQEPPFDKTIVNGKQVYSYGDRITYQVSTKIPADILDYHSFKINDASDQALTFEKGSLKATIDGKDVSSLYQETDQAHGFDLNFQSIRSLGAYAGKTVHVQYDMKLTSNEQVDTAILNTAKLITDHETITKKVDIETGGKKFQKVDLTNQKGLTGAVFVVLDKHDRYLIQTATGYDWSDNGSDAHLVTLVSGNDGFFEIKGLTYGAYRLQETQAPNGYEKSKVNVPFVVDATSYSNSADVLKVVNKPLKPNTPVVPGKPNVPEKPHNPNIPWTPYEPNQPSEPNEPDEPLITGTHRLPQTNDRINKRLIWVGGTLIAFVLITFLVGKRKRKGKKEE